jgi:DNA-binding transcriptional regulator WhiA
LHPPTSPTPEEEDAAKEKRREAEATLLAHEEKVNLLPNKLRRLYMLRRQNPNQSVDALARRLGKTPATIRNWNAKIDGLLSE